MAGLVGYASSDEDEPIEQPNDEPVSYWFMNGESIDRREHRLTGDYIASQRRTASSTANKGSSR
jgi:hypothetical protein